jgi:hypothetical protein
MRRYGMGLDHIMRMPRKPVHPWSSAIAAAASIWIGCAAAAAPATLSEADQPCAGCHEQAIDTASFATSVHSPLGCAACHSAIDLQKHPGDVGANRAAQKVPAHSAEVCMGCHEASREAHRKWLPNATTHLAVVACAACHAPGAKRRVELRLYDVKASREVAMTQAPDAAVAKAGGLPGAPLDVARIDKLVAAANEGNIRVMLVGRVETGASDTHHLTPKGTAVKECSTCHRKGADAFEQVTLSLVGPDGARSKYEAQQDVLNAPMSIDTVRGFYALGGTRIQALDVLLGLALMGGIGAPIGHAVMRKLTRAKKGKDD